MPDDFVLDLGRLQQHYDDWGEGGKRDEWAEEMEKEWDNSNKVFSISFLIICFCVLDLVFRFVICLFVLFLRAG